MRRLFPLNSISFSILPFQSTLNSPRKSSCTRFFLFFFFFYPLNSRAYKYKRVASTEQEQHSLWIGDPKNKSCADSRFSSFEIVECQDFPIGVMKSWVSKPKKAFSLCDMEVKFSVVSLTGVWPLRSTSSFAG